MSSSKDNLHVPEVFAAQTDVGCVREHNEDSYVAEPPLFVVADGMGGHEAGEVASAIAIRTMVDAELREPDADQLANAVRAANRAVLRGAEDGTGKPGMGTTMTAALVFDDEVIIAQVGDSRAYLLHNGKLQRVTRDHSLVADLIEQGRITEEEARFHPQRSVITRALGSDPQMEPDLYQIRVEKGDRLLLCSDGLSSMIVDDSIAAILATNEEPDACCAALVKEAIAAGGLDNVTVIVVDPLKKKHRNEDVAAPVVDLADEPAQAQQAQPAQQAQAAQPTEAPASQVSDAARPFATPEAAAKAKPKSNMATAQKKAEKKAKRKSRKGPIIWIIAFVLIIAAACGGFYMYAHNSYYLISEDGYVTVYQGLPGDFAGIKVSHLLKQTDIKAEKLNPTVANRLQYGISVDSLDAANALIDEYHKQLGDGESSEEATDTRTTNGEPAASASSSSSSADSGSEKKASAKNSTKDSSKDTQKQSK